MNKTKNTALLRTYEKDYIFDVLKAKRTGRNITYLATFPFKNKSLKAYNLELIQKPTNIIRLPHVKLELKIRMKDDYKAAISTIKNSYNVGIVATKNINKLNKHPNKWVKERSKNNSTRIFNPL